MPRRQPCARDAHQSDIALGASQPFCFSGRPGPHNGGTTLISSPDGKLSHFTIRGQSYTLRMSVTRTRGGKFLAASSAQTEHRDGGSLAHVVPVELDRCADMDDLRLAVDDVADES